VQQGKLGKEPCKLFPSRKSVETFQGGNSGGIIMATSDWEKSKAFPWGNRNRRVNASSGDHFHEVV